MSVDLIFLLNTFASFFMTGLIWCVQLVHYPSFRFVDKNLFKEFHPLHSIKIGFIVVPAMITELVTSFLLFWNSGWLALNSIGFYLVILLWISTGLLSVPFHYRLSKGKDHASIVRLISTNWIRTILWTIKSGINFWVLLEMLNGF